MSLSKFKRIALFIHKLLGGPKISKLGHVTLSHAHFDTETNLCRHPIHAAKFYASGLIHC